MLILNMNYKCRLKIYHNFHACKVKETVVFFELYLNIRGVSNALIFNVFWKPRVV